MDKILSVLLFLFLIFTSLVGCSDGKPSDQSSNSSQSISDMKVPDNIQQKSSENIIEITGTVVYKDIEGGFYAIDADDGNKYDPINLPEQFKKDSLKVKVTAEKKTDMMSSHMYGEIVDIVSIENR